MNYSHDYEELIGEIKSDIAEELISLSDQLKVVRRSQATYNNYYPIIDYYYPDNNPNEAYTVMTVEDVLEEMEHYHKIIKDKPSLKSLRLDAGLTQKQLADIIGTQQQQITRWESGAVKPSNYKILFKLAAALNISVDELVKIIG